MQRTTTQRPPDPVTFTTTRPRPGGGGRGRPWRLGTRLRTTVRRGLLACLGVVGLAGVAGCQDCDERFCRGVRLATVQMMAASAECCAGVEDRACPDLERRFDELVRALHEAHDACEAGNYERLRELLESILGSLPRMFLLGFCGVDVDLGDWLEEACHPYVNATTAFLPGDELATSIRLLESGATGRTPDGPGAWSPGRAADRFPGSVEYAVLPGSHVDVSAWWGPDRYTVTGSLGLGGVGGAGARGSVESGGPVLESLALRLDSTSEGPDILIDHPGPGAPSLVRVDGSGRGRLGAAVWIELVDDPGGVLPDGTGWTAWIELPVRVSGGRVELGDGAPAPADVVFPVDPGHHEAGARLDLLVAHAGGELLGDDVAPSPCRVRDGFSEREWRWFQRMRQCFPECFTQP